MAYIPAQGDVMWINFDPQAGHEQGGRRPAPVLSWKSYNNRAHLSVLCPITKQVKGYIFEVPVPSGSGVTGVLLADQVKSMDWTARDVEYICTLPVAIVEQVVNKITALISI